MSHVRATLSDGMVVFVDTRERASKLAELLSARKDVSVIVKQLPSGDYAIGRTVGIERKTGNDFAHSIVDGRLFPQLGFLRKFYVRPLLLLENLRQGEPTAGVAWHAISGALVSTATIFGVPILYSSGVEESAGLIAVAARQLSRTFQDGYVRAGYRPKNWRRRALFILQGFPGIGPSRAAALLNACESVKGVITADELTVQAVQGIGVQIARSIRKAAGPQPEVAFRE